MSNDKRNPFRVPNSFERALIRSQKDTLALALERVFGGYCHHLPADDPFWTDMAVCVIDTLTGEAPTR